MGWIGGAIGDEERKVERLKKVKRYGAVGLEMKGPGLELEMDLELQWKWKSRARTTRPAEQVSR